VFRKILREKGNWGENEIFLKKRKKKKIFFCEGKGMKRGGVRKIVGN
jgi:hypothetical protein